MIDDLSLSRQRSHLYSPFFSFSVQLYCGEVAEARATAAATAAETTIQLANDSTEKKTTCKMNG